MASRRYNFFLILLIGMAACREPSDPEENIALIYIYNHTTTTFESLYAARCGVTAWGEDRLGSAPEVFQPNTIRAVAVEPGCWNVRVVTADGRTADRNSIELTRGKSVDWKLTTF